jgi:hypothetical protein
MPVMLDSVRAIVLLGSCAAIFLIGVMCVTAGAPLSVLYVPTVAAAIGAMFLLYNRGEIEQGRRRRGCAFGAGTTCARTSAACARSAVRRRHDSENASIAHGAAEHGAGRRAAHQGVADNGYRDAWSAQQISGNRYHAIPPDDQFALHDVCCNV